MTNFFLCFSLSSVCFRHCFACCAVVAATASYWNDCGDIHWIEGVIMILCSLTKAHITFPTACAFCRVFHLLGLSLPSYLHFGHLPDLHQQSNGLIRINSFSQILTICSPETTLWICVYNVVFLSIELDSRISFVVRMKNKSLLLNSQPRTKHKWKRKSIQIVISSRLFFC